jgi:hypothetical protein
MSGQPGRRFDPEAIAHAHVFVGMPPGHAKVRMLS